MKIKPGWDVDVVRQVRERFPAIKLMADANSAYTLADTEHLRKLDDFYLMMIEQPLSHDDIIDHAELQARLKTPICLDECIRSAHHAEQAVKLHACGIINIKLGRVGGFAEARRVHDVAQAAGIPVWCGGMLEAGIGRAHNIALATLPEFCAARRRVGQQALLDRVTSSSPPVGDHSPRNDRGARRPRIRLRHRPRLHPPHHRPGGNCLTRSRSSHVRTRHSCPVVHNGFASGTHERNRSCRRPKHRRPPRFRGLGAGGSNACRAVPQMRAIHDGLRLPLA